MRALVTGGTGFVGRRLVRELQRPVVLSRDPERARRVLGAGCVPEPWSPAAGPPPLAAFAGVDAVFHLAGEPIAEGRWSAAKKARIRESRVAGTRHLVDALARLDRPPPVLVAASAVGYYGDRGDEILDEGSPPGSDFLAQLCRDWEAEALRAAGFGVRVVVVRNGMVLGRNGGALPKMLPPFRLGLGGCLASGRQWMPWIHEDDLAGLMLEVATRSDFKGPVNAVAPTPCTNLEFTRRLAAVLRRPAVLPVPALVLRVAFGEVAGVMLASQRVVPRVAERAGYRFLHPTIEPGLRAALGAGPRGEG